MKNPNDRTIEAYSEPGSVARYIAATPPIAESDAKGWVDRCVNELAPDARILEIGSGGGRDADYIESLGWHVVRTDAVKGFVDYQVERGKDAYMLNVISEPLPQGFDLIVADAVLVHFSDSDSELVVEKVYDALNPGGRFGARVKEGEGEEEKTDDKMDKARYFNYWQQADFEELLVQAGFSRIETDKGTSSRQNHPAWLQVIAHK